MSVSGNVGEEKIHPDLWNTTNGSVGLRGFKTKWNSDEAEGSSGAQASIEENVIHVPDNSKPTGFRYYMSNKFRAVVQPFHI